MEIRTTLAKVPRIALVLGAAVASSSAFADGIEALGPANIPLAAGPGFAIGVNPTIPVGSQYSDLLVVLAVLALLAAASLHRQRT